MDHETLEDIMDDLREIHATHCKDWDASFICNCPILQVMNKIYATQHSVQRTTFLAGLGVGVFVATVIAIVVINLYGCR